MATLTKFNDFAEQIGKGVHNFSAHTFKVGLTNTAPNAATNTGYGDITEISAGNGYTAGGNTLTCSWSETSGTAKLTITDSVFTASGGSIGPFRYAVIYNDTATSPADALVGYLDYGSALTLAATETFTLDFDATAGVLTIA